MGKLDRWKADALRGMVATRVRLALGDCIQDRTVRLVMELRYLGEPRKRSIVARQANVVLGTNLNEGMVGFRERRGLSMLGQWLRREEAPREGLGLTTMALAWYAEVVADGMGEMGVDASSGVSYRRDPLANLAVGLLVDGCHLHGGHMDERVAGLVEGWDAARRAAARRLLGLPDLDARPGAGARHG